MEETTRLKQFLEAIIAFEGRVCENYETCDHPACRSSYAAWSLAEAALSGKTLEELRIQQNQIAVTLQHAREGLLVTFAIECVECGAHLVLSRYRNDESLIRCKCGSQHVRMIPVERNDYGFINNCGLNCTGSSKNCQMCGGGPCPEEIKFIEYKNYIRERG